MLIGDWSRWLRYKECLGGPLRESKNNNNKRGHSKRSDRHGHVAALLAAHLVAARAAVPATWCLLLVRLLDD